RPGPVIRNEWRNGGYPAWLLRRPEYDMPLHDVLEGRYPATATLQNAHSDDAAKEWLANDTHRRFASRWLRTLLRDVQPWSSDVIAIALDDDQGAYLDNQTWPAPHLAQYLRYLRGVVQEITGPHVPLFINTYQMKVTASSPVWAWGNWYQGDAYAIGEHDRAQLELDTGLLQTRPLQPAMISEFQAGWLQGPDETQPRPADPTNTALALGSLIGIGAHGIVNFPVQDTLYPAGDEVPFANAFYGWDAALTIEGAPSARYAPTATWGAILAAYGPALARSHRVADAAVAYLTSAYDPRSITNDEIATIAQQTILAQQWCRAASLACDLVDLHYVSRGALRHYPLLVVPRALARPFVDAQTNAALAAFRNAHPSSTFDRNFSERDVARARTEANALLARALHARTVDGFAGATVLQTDGGAPQLFLAAQNYSAAPVRAALTVHVPGLSTRHVQLTLPARSATVQPLDVQAPEIFPLPLSRGVTPETPLPLDGYAFPAQAAFRRVPPHQAVAYRADVFGDGAPVVVMENTLVRVIVSPSAGGRGFVFESKASGRSMFNTIGAMRDGLALPPSPSPRDYIAKYTHEMDAGTFNRPYDAAILRSGSIAVVRLSYAAQDLGGTHFVRTLRLLPDERELRLESRATQPAKRFDALSVGDASDDPRTIRILIAQHDAPLSIGTTVTLEASMSAIALYSTKTHELAVLRWSTTPGPVTVDERRQGIIVEVPSGTAARARYAYDTAPTLAGARAAFEHLTGRTSDGANGGARR
ncbi:MAG: hypothetical protein JOZ38_08420, partial [Candidatus Eremiobacteraeota bacterium]|nr:hypothetical protein [Candidatus Eremiobacteraeota bacterium]